MRNTVEYSRSTMDMGIGIGAGVEVKTNEI